MKGTTFKGSKHAEAKSTGNIEVLQSAYFDEKDQEYTALSFVCHHITLQYYQINTW